MSAMYPVNWKPFLWFSLGCFVIAMCLLPLALCSGQQLNPYGPAPGYSAPQASYPGPIYPRRFLLPHYPGLPVRNFVRVRVWGLPPIGAQPLQPPAEGFVR